MGKPGSRPGGNPKKNRPGKMRPIGRERNSRRFRARIPIVIQRHADPELLTSITSEFVGFKTRRKHCQGGVRVEKARQPRFLVRLMNPNQLANEEFRGEIAIEHGLIRTHIQIPVSDGNGRNGFSVLHQALNIRPELNDRLGQLAGKTGVFETGGEIVLSYRVLHNQLSPAFMTALRDLLAIANSFSPAPKKNSH